MEQEKQTSKQRIETLELKIGYLESRIDHLEKMVNLYYAANNIIIGLVQEAIDKINKNKEEL